MILSAVLVQLMSKRTFEEEIDEKGKIIYTNVGDSMMPLIREKRDVLMIEKVNGGLKRLDVPLYKRDSGQYVLHRILKVRDKDYIICGDNRYCKETGITDRHIIGVLTGVIRDGKQIPMNSLSLRLYAHLWCDFFPIRAFILKVKGYMKRRHK